MGTDLKSTLAAAVMAAALICTSASAADPPRLKVALTFDDLPINGTLPLGARQSDFARDTVQVLEKHRIPPSHGFVNANKLERNPDGAYQLFRIGDAVAARNTHAAIYDALRLAKDI